jgi:hypothetical protein
MNEALPATPGADGLEAKSEAELAALIAKAQEALARREQERQKRAIEQIQEIARANGLSVTIAKQSRRGRPPKKTQG